MANNVHPYLFKLKHISVIHFMLQRKGGRGGARESREKEGGRGVMVGGIGRAEEERKPEPVSVPFTVRARQKWDLSLNYHTQSGSRRSPEGFGRID